ncbi:MAG: NADH-quinone oxidoreductase subunit N, partial [Chitinophagaceae bacterium]
MNAIILSAVWGIIMMYSGIFFKYKSGITKLAIFGILLLIISNWMELSGVSFIAPDLHGMLLFTTFGYVFNIVAFFSTLIYFLLSGDDIVEVGKNPAEYYALIFFVLCGISIVSSFDNLLMLFIGIEIVSIPLYILAGSDKKNLKSNEASLKYFLMGSFSTGIMLMGIALLYGSAGSFALSALGFGVGTLSPIMALGLVLLLVSLGFKASAAPFHFWTPDVYDG